MEGARRGGGGEKNTTINPLDHTIIHTFKQRRGNTGVEEVGENIEDDGKRRRERRRGEERRAVHRPFP